MDWQRIFCCGSILHLQKGIYLKDRLGRWAPEGSALGVQLPTFFVIIPKLKNFGKIAAFSRYNTDKDMSERGEP